MAGLVAGRVAVERSVGEMELHSPPESLLCHRLGRRIGNQGSRRGVWLLSGRGERGCPASAPPGAGSFKALAISARRPDCPHRMPHNISSINLRTTLSKQLESSPIFLRRRKTFTLANIDFYLAANRSRHHPPGFWPKLLITENGSTATERTPVVQSGCSRREKLEIVPQELRDYKQITAQDHS